MNLDTGCKADASSTGSAAGTAPCLEAAGGAAFVATLAAAAGMVLMVWAIYAAFDWESFDFQATVLLPALHAGTEAAVVASSRDPSRSAR